MKNFIMNIIVFTLFLSIILLISTMFIEPFIWIKCYFGYQLALVMLGAELIGVILFIKLVNKWNEEYDNY